MKKIIIKKMGEMSSSSSLNFFNDCYRNCKSINDVPCLMESFTSFDEVKTFYGDYPYLVENDEEGIGFFFDDFDSFSNAIGLSAYIASSHSKGIAYRKLNTVILCGTLHSYNRIVTEKIEFIELNTFSEAIVNNVKFLVPNIKIHRIRDEYIILYSRSDEFDSSVLKALYGSSLIKKDLVETIFEFSDKLGADGNFFYFY
jgi:hypothetical protein